jgi:O-antigen/teichoic acid export membrane protein
MAIFRQISGLARHSAIYAIGTIIQRLPGFLLLPVYTNFNYIPSQSDYGDYTIVYTFIAFMNFVYLYGMDSSMLRYFFLGEKDRKTVFSTTFFILLLTGFFTTLMMGLFSTDIAGFILQRPDYGPLIRLAGLILFFDSLGNMPYLILRAEEKSVQFTIFKSSRFFLELLFNIIFVVFLRMGVFGIFYTSLTASIINLVMMLPIIFRYLQKRIDFKLWKEMLTFGLPLLPNGIAFMTIEMIDRLIVPAYLGKEALASYGASYRFGTLLLFMITAFRNAWQPFFLKIANQENARQIYARVLTYFVLGGGLLLLIISYFVRDVLTFHFFGEFYILNNRSYWDGISIIPIILLSYLFYGIYVIFTPGFYIKKESKYMIAFTGSGAILNVISNMILLPLLNSFWGAAWATLISYFVMMLTIYLVANRIYPIPIEWGRITKIFILIIALLAVYYAFELNLWFRLLIILAAALYSLFGIVQPGERRALKARLGRFRK